MANDKTAKKSTNPIVMVGIGCLILLALIGIVISIIMHFFAKRVGVGLLQGAIENRTGVKTNLQDLANGKMSFTDTKTGSSVNIGSGTLPDAFPKDFPVYPGAKVTSSMSGSDKGASSGFWVTLTTSDDLGKVSSFYKSAFATNGWTIGTTFSAGNTATESVTKGNWSGTVAFSQDTSKKETDIVVAMGQETPTPADSTGNSSSGE